MDDLYREQILDHYKNPRNYGDLVNPTVSSEEYNPLCGDRIFLQLLINKGKIMDVKFKGEGCAISTASASLLTEYIKSKNISDLKKLEGQDVLPILGIENLSPGRLKCALLPLEALRKSIVSLDELDKKL